MNINLDKAPLSTEEFKEKQKSINNELAINTQRYHWGYMVYVLIILLMCIGFVWFLYSGYSAEIIKYFTDIESLEEAPPYTVLLLPVPGLMYLIFSCLIIIFLLWHLMNAYYFPMKMIEQYSDGLTELNTSNDSAKFKEILSWSNEYPVIKNYIHKLNTLNRLPTHEEYEVFKKWVNQVIADKNNKKLLEELGYKNESN